MAALQMIEQIEKPNDFKPKLVMVRGKLQEGSTVKKIN